MTVGGVDLAQRAWRTQVDTTDIDEARFLLSSSYCPHSISPMSTREAFHAQQQHADTPIMQLYRLSYGAGTATVDAVPFGDFVLVSRVLRGRFTVERGAEARVLSIGDTVALDPVSAYRMQWSDGCELLTVQLDRRAVEEAAGLDAGGLGRVALAPTHSRALEAWNRTATMAVGELIDSGLVEDAPLLVGELRRLVGAALLNAFPQNSHSPAAVAPGGSRSLGAALEYIEANAHAELTLGDVARAVHLSPRSLQELFHARLGTTPTAAMREARLRRAHFELRAAEADDGVTVSAVAARWGFTNLGRFAHLHRATFGTSPAETLRAVPRI